MASFVIRDFVPGAADSEAFARINRQWIESMYRLEPVDEAQLGDPYREIVAPGGAILLAEDTDLGVIGTCGLLRTGAAELELIKMAVLPVAQGRGVGEALLRGGIVRAHVMGAASLFLLTNSKSQAAIRLYERAGFVHDADLLARAGGEYDRCDVAMRFAGNEVS